MKLADLEERRIKMMAYLSKLFPEKDGIFCVVMVTGDTEDAGYACGYQSTMDADSAIEHLRRTADAIERAVKAQRKVN